MKLMQLLRGLQISASVLTMALGVLSVIGMLLSKKWGTTWAIITSVLAALIALPGFFQRMSGFTLIETLAKIALAVAIIVLCLLPKSRHEAVPITA